MLNWMQWAGSPLHFDWNGVSIMKVRLKFIGVVDIEVPSELRIDGDASVLEVIEYLENLNSMEIDGLTVLVNKEKSSLERTLKEGDEILLLQPIGGG